MTMLPESSDDRARLLELFVFRLQEINKKSGCVLGTYQILEMLEDIAIKERMLDCPTCGRKHV